MNPRNITANKDLNNGSAFSRGAMPYSGAALSAGTWVMLVLGVRNANSLRS